MECVQHDDLIVIGSSAAVAADQLGSGVDGEIHFEIDRLRKHLDAHQASLTDLCHIRVFYVPARGFGETPLLTSLAKELKETVRPAVSVIPLSSEVNHERAIQLEAIAVTRGMRRELEFDGAYAPNLRSHYAAAVSCGRFVFFGAVSATAQHRGDIVVESYSVMRCLEKSLAQLGCNFADVVKMNRWYLGSASKDNWEPSARAVAAFYQEPGPVATAIPLSTSFDDGVLIRIELLAMQGEDQIPLPHFYSWPEGHWDWPIHLPYKHGLSCDGLAFVGGQVSLDRNAAVIDPGDLRGQVRRSMENIDAVLQGLGFNSQHLLRLGMYQAGSATSQQEAKVLLPPVPQVVVALPHLSYPDMVVEIEAMAGLRNGSKIGT